MPKLALRAHLDEAVSGSSMLLDKEFDEEVSLAERDGLLFLLNL